MNSIDSDQLRAQRGHLSHLQEQLDIPGVPLLHAGLLKTGQGLTNE